jgi:thiol-disulfide isomerase/thioredoxin
MNRSYKQPWHHFWFVIFFVGSACAEESARPVSVDSTFWSWTPTSIKNQSVDMAMLRGKYILLNFWGEWCETCRQETPFLVKLHQKYGRLAMVGVFKSYNLGQTRKWIDDNHLDWPQVPITDKIESYFKIKKFPTNLLISPDGEIVMDGFSHHYRDFVRRMELGDTVGIE